MTETEKEDIRKQVARTFLALETTLVALQQKLKRVEFLETCTLSREYDMLAKAFLEYRSYTDAEYLDLYSQVIEQQRIHGVM